jgi:hypothetical protein
MLKVLDQPLLICTLFQTKKRNKNIAEDFLSTQFQYVAEGRWDDDIFFSIWYRNTGVQKENPRKSFFLRFPVCSEKMNGI